MEIKEKLDKELDRELDQLGEMELGTDAMVKAVSTIETLHKLRMNEKNSDDSSELENKKLKIELKKSQNLLIGSLVATGASFALGVYRTDALRWLMNVTTEFEKTGIYVSKASGELVKGAFNLMFKDK